MALAAQRLEALMEMWLGGVPIEIGPGIWLEPPTERRYTVPSKIKRALAEKAINDVMGFFPGLERPHLVDVLEYVWRETPHVTLRRKRRTAGKSKVEAAFQAYEERLANAWKGVTQPP